jgi:hypothetical protein
MRSSGPNFTKQPVNVSDAKHLDENILIVHLFLSLAHRTNETHMTSEVLRTLNTVKVTSGTLGTEGLPGIIILWILEHST